MKNIYKFLIIVFGTIIAFVGVSRYFGKTHYYLVESYNDEKPVRVSTETYYKTYEYLNLDLEYDKIYKYDIMIGIGGGAAMGLLLTLILFRRDFFPPSDKHDR